MRKGEGQVMIEPNLMREWAGIVESVAFLAVVILAIGAMLRVVKPSDAARCLGAILCVVILLLMLPAILVTAWHTMASWQQFGIVALGIMIVLSLWALRQPRKKRKER
jgi:hypothetical protein